MVLVNSLAYMIVAAIATPPLLGLILPQVFQYREAYLFTLPTVVAYCGLIYALGLSIAAKELLKREIEIIQAVKPER